MVLRRVYFSVFGSGLGHASRIVEIANHLRREGDQFRYSCSGQALDYVRSHGKDASLVESPSLDF
jgi:UDP:flavonoid glycosyltransferase YjiC (YdhE family)